MVFRLCAIAFLLSLRAPAMDSVTVLPKGIYSPSWRQGTILNADQKYTSTGELYGLSDLNSVELNVNNLQAIEPDIKKLENALNKFGQNDLGSTLHLGVLKVTTQPNIQYSVPILGHGFTERWMVGLALPIIRYTNKLNFLHSGSNLKELKAQFYGLSDSLDDAFNRLDQDLPTVAQQTLIEKGYKPIVDRKETLIGDLQLAHFYLLYKDTIFGLRWQSLVNLPTGPKDDPDDLVDLASFGKTAWENSILANITLWERVVFALKSGYRWTIADRAKVRVPLNRKDTLPGKDRLAWVDRDLGDTFNVGGSISYNFSSEWILALGLDHMEKTKDIYSGSLNGDYSLLSKDTAGFSQRIQYELSYDSVSQFLRKKALIPMILALNFSDTYNGKNVERLMQTEMTATLFF